ncbi:pesticin C-terminus-like muramidase [Skermanella pratensis]|uniref:pesticin C-terminus-like muramidase n=1 Tax=Skermanella pratensis TaxID=2233999 RepID=UPI0013011B35|nr:pesticin C-terminus-like muramidase [Skermanella pratensis]
MTGTAGGPNADKRVSPNGLAFLYNREAQKGVSNKPHWPGGSSGVTLGPGYDLGHRTAAQIIADLTNIGVSADAAQTLSLAAGKTGNDAKAFVQANSGAVTLTQAQEQALLDIALPPYEKDVKTYVKVAVNQNQFDAMVSLDYNIGGGNFKNSSVVANINKGDFAAAAESFKLWNKSGGQVVQGLVNRRNLEVALFNTPV